MNKKARIDLPSFQIRGQMWDLMGELVQTYEARFANANNLYVPLSTDSMQRTDLMPNGPGGVAYCLIHSSLSGSRQVSLDESTAQLHDGEKQKHFELSVSRDLFDEIRIMPTFHMGITFFRGPDGPNGSVVREYPGIMDRGGEWGWDVPGSPSWTNAFWTGGVTDWRLMTKQEATNFWTVLCCQIQDYRVTAEVSDLELDLTHFLEECWKVNPDAIGKFLTNLGGFTVLAERQKELLTENSAAEQQARQILKQVAGRIAGEAEAGKSINSETRRSLQKTMGTVTSGSPKLREMALRVNEMIKLNTPALDTLLRRQPFSFSYGTEGYYIDKQGITVRVRRNPETGEVEFQLSGLTMEWVARLAGGWAPKEWYRLGSLQRVDAQPRYSGHFPVGSLNFWVFTESSG
jgi:hypothetical protein